MKLFVVLAVLFVTACSDSDNAGAPGGSTPASPTTTPTSGQDGLPLTLQSQLETFFEVANGEALQEMSAILLRLVSPVESGFSLESSTTDETDLSNRETYRCTEGGTVEVWSSSSVANEPRTNAVAKECAFGPRVVTGVFYLTEPINVSDDSYLLVSEVRDYTVTDNVDESTTTLKAGTVRYSSSDASGNRVHVAEGGPANFTASVINALRSRGVADETLKNIRVVQHSWGWNEQNTDAHALDTVRRYAQYIRIADGNLGNREGNNHSATPDYEIKNGAHPECTRFRSRALSSRYSSQWKEALQRVRNKCDGSDAVEILWILGIRTSTMPTLGRFADVYF